MLTEKETKMIEKCTITTSGGLSATAIRRPIQKRSSVAGWTLSPTPRTRSEAQL